MPDEKFETRFAKMADEQIREQCASLMPYRVGFQLLDKEEDGARAVGVAAFIINNVWAFMPIFFGEGRLKGFVLLYIKNTDMFVPAKDNWVSTLRDQGARAFGAAESNRDHDVSLKVSPQQALVQSESFPYAMKVASEAGPDGYIEAETLRQMMIKPLQKLDTDLLTKVAELGLQASAVFSRTILENPDFANSVHRFYTPAQLRQFSESVMKQAAAKADDAPKSGSLPNEVEFYLGYSDPKAKELDDNAKRVLARTGMYVKDERKEHTKVFTSRVTTGTYTNTSTTGLYNILLANGKTELCLAIPIENRVGQYARNPADIGGRDVAIIPVSTPTKFYRRRMLEVFGNRIERIGEEIPKETQFGYPANRANLTNGREGGEILLQQGTRKNMLVRIPWQSGPSDSKEPSPRIKTDTIIVEAGDDAPRTFTVAEGNAAGAKELLFTGQPGKLRVSGTILRVPEDVRMFVQHKYEDDSKLTLGNLSTIEEYLTKEAGLRRLSLCTDGGSVQISCTDNTKSGLTGHEAVRSLVLDHGIFAGQAQQMLKEAARTPSRRISFLLKYAASPNYGNRLSDSTTTGRPAVSYTTSVLTREKPPAPHVLPHAVINQATAASNAGQKEIFDVSVLASLVEAADIAEIRKDKISDMIRGMDSCGRMLFLFYWHKDVFEQRYGRDDLQKLEDSLKSLFLKTGDVVLFLKQKKAFAPDEDDNLFGQLSEDIGTQAQE